MNKIQELRAKLMLRKAVVLADSMHKENGWKYYVCPNSDDKVRLIVTDRKNFRRLRMKGYVSDFMDMRDVEQVCFYHTADRAGNKPITDDEKVARSVSFLMWYESRLPRWREARRRKVRNYFARTWKRLQFIFSKKRRES